MPQQSPARPMDAGGSEGAMGPSSLPRLTADVSATYHVYQRTTRPPTDGRRRRMKSPMPHAVHMCRRGTRPETRSSSCPAIGTPRSALRSATRAPPARHARVGPAPGHERSCPRYEAAITAKATGYPHEAQRCRSRAPRRPRSEGEGEADAECNVSRGPDARPRGRPAGPATEKTAVPKGSSAPAGRGLSRRRGRPHRRWRT
jgi:hypothetical protein